MQTKGRVRSCSLSDDWVNRTERFLNAFLRNLFATFRVLTCYSIVLCRSYFLKAKTQGER